MYGVLSQIDAWSARYSQAILSSIRLWGFVDAFGSMIGAAVQPVIKTKQAMSVVCFIHQPFLNTGLLSQHWMAVNLPNRSSPFLSLKNRSSSPIPCNSLWCVGQRGIVFWSPDFIPIPLSPSHGLNRWWASTLTAPQMQHGRVRMNLRWVGLLTRLDLERDVFIRVPFIAECRRWWTIR